MKEANIPLWSTIYLIICVALAVKLFFFSSLVWYIASPVWFLITEVIYRLVFRKAGLL